MAGEQISASDLKAPEIEALFEAGAHVGYSKMRRHPKMQEFLFGVRNNVEIFDLIKTVSMLGAAEEFLQTLGREGKSILWVGTKAPARQAVLDASGRTNMPYVAERWLGGTLTNFRIFEGRLAYWAKLEEEQQSGGLDKYSKKERLLKIVEIRKLARKFGGLKNLKSLPHALVIVDPGEEKTALAEAKRKNIPVVALLNVDCNPDGIKYLVPLNDNSAAAISLALGKLAAAYETGLKEKQT